MGITIRKTRFYNVFTDGKYYYTINLMPTEKVYGEMLFEKNGVEYRRWPPYRSKLAAFLHKNCHTFPFQKDSKVLYLGAASGTTVSHISDICTEGLLYCVEISHYSFRKLLALSFKRPNIIPLLNDANRPEEYCVFIDKRVDIIYQDIAQKNQVAIFLKNIDYFLADEGVGIIFVKARCIDVSAKPKKVFGRVAEELQNNQLKCVEKVTLEPFEKDHCAIVVRRK